MIKFWQAFSARPKSKNTADEAEKRAESQELLLAAIVESSDDAIIGMTKDYATFVSWNKGAERMYGYTAREIVGKPISILVPPESPGEVEGIMRKIAQGERLERYETTRVRKDGTRIQVSLTVSPIRVASGEIIGISTIARDITETKKAEDRLRRFSEQLRALSTHLQSIREEERTNLARDIHDELGQSLTGLKMDLSMLMKRPPEDRGLLTDRLRSMGEIVDDIIKAVRKLSTQLRPGILDDLGLIAAIEWQVEDFMNRTGIRSEISSTLSDYDLDRDLATALFRILQETLTNIVRHANATDVKIDLKTEAGLIIMTVEDNGRGITEEEVSDPKSLGLLGMRERAYALGGEVNIGGNRERGTRVVVKIPFKRADKQDA